jgi:nucleotidyltransferase/DNA polymerase involved in DNA repair
MVKIKDKERAIIEITCIPDVGIEKAEKLYDMGFKHLRELLEFSLDEEAKVRGFVEILNFRILNQFLKRYTVTRKSVVIAEHFFSRKF